MSNASRLARDIRTIRAVLHDLSQSKGNFIGISYRNKEGEALRALAESGEIAIHYWQSGLQYARVEIINLQ